MKFSKVPTTTEYSLGPKEKERNKCGLYCLSSVDRQPPVAPGDSCAVFMWCNTSSLVHYLSECWCPHPIYNGSAQAPVLLKLKTFLFLPTAQLRLVSLKIHIHKGKAQEAYLWKRSKFVPAALEIPDPKIQGLYWAYSKQNVGDTGSFEITGVHFDL